MTLLLNAIALLLVVLALAYALKKLLPAAWWRRGSGNSAAGQCGGGCSGCGSAATAPVRSSNGTR